MRLPSQSEITRKGGVEMNPFSSQTAVLRMVLSAVIGGYGLTFITMSVLLLLAYVLYQIPVI